MAKRTTPKNIDQYIAWFSPEVQERLQRIRTLVQEISPESTETISYQMPAFTRDGVWIFFAAFQQHIGIYPPVPTDEQLAVALAPYRGPKGNLQFPLAERLPVGLLRRVIKALANAHQARRSQSKRKLTTEKQKTQRARKGNAK
ncbi:MAG: DUF1801 domain-containing protein [Planctomycetaceae bacterium]|nr:DUF1801 domain-containing protein [Planctomycetaceae bacterium]